MSYIDSNLLPDEQVVYRSQLHWVIFVQPVFWLLLTMVLYFYLKTNEGYLHHVSQTYKIDFFKMAKALLFVPLFFAILSALSSFIDYISTEFGVTNKRVIMKQGFIRRHTFENFLQKVENIQIYQSVLGRILGYGTVMLHGTGGTREPFYLIDDPLAFRKQIQAQVDNVLEKE